MARPRAQAPTQAPRASSPTTAHDSSSSSSSEESELVEAVLPPFFNTTFSTHRLSPLYVGAQKLNQTRLDALAHRLRDTLVGDVVRGIQVNLQAAETPAGGQQVGALRAVKFRWFRADDVLGDEPTGGHALAQWSDEQRQGLWLEIRHENASYVALLLPARGGASEGQGFDSSRFVELPLLLLKMPLALKSVVAEWLASTFDCRVSKLSLGTRTLVRMWEGWMQVAGHAGNSADLVVTLAFNAPLAPWRAITGRDEDEDKDKDKDEDEDEDADEAGLKTLEITIPSTELRRFLRAGKAILEEDKDKKSRWDKLTERERRRLAGPNIDDGWAWRNFKGKDEPRDPFTEALAKYLEHHLALDLFHPSVRVVQVACGGFVLAQSRVKMVRVGGATEDSARAAWMFVMQLGERIRGASVT